MFDGISLQYGRSRLFIIYLCMAHFAADFAVLCMNISAGFFTLSENAKVKGKLFDMGSYPAGVPAIDDSYIIGELYKIQDESEFSWAIGQLDDYEGVNVESDEIQLYRRELTDVFINDGIIPAWIYWYNGDVSGRPVIASGDLMEYLEKKK